MMRFLPYTFSLLLLHGISFILAQENEGVGVLPFDWSGQWGIYHQYGFSGWGMDYQDGPLFFDGNFAHWPQRYAFPFSEKAEKGDEESGVESSLWYRKGDYSLDEFAFDVNFIDDMSRNYRFQALKRNFQDQYGLLGPITRPDGTVQQNYRLLIDLPVGENEEWQIGSAYYRTSDGIPDTSTMGWEKGAFRLDKIVGNGVKYIKIGERYKSVFHISYFAQRLNIKSISDIKRWKADLISYRLIHEVEFKSDVKKGYFFNYNIKYSGLTSENIGYSSLLSLSTIGGRWWYTGPARYRFGIGLGFVSPGRSALNLLAMVDYGFSLVNVSLSIQNFIHSLPFPMSIKIYPGIYPEESASSQQRTIAQLKLIFDTQLININGGVFFSRSAPHFFFEEQLFKEYGDTGHYSPVVSRLSTDLIPGMFWDGKVNFFREWWLQTSWVSLLQNKEGWGNGIQHEGTLSLTLNELLFRKRLDARVRLWTNFWIGRNRYVWDPMLSLGYYSHDDVYSQDATALLNVEFKGVISNFEISYTMMNILYAARDYLSDYFSYEDLTLIGTPRLPPPGRLFFITIQWNFRD